MEGSNGTRNREVGKDRGSGWYRGGTSAGRYKADLGVLGLERSSEMDVILINPQNVPMDTVPSYHSMNSKGEGNQRD
jgi:hypothetical protein